MAPSKCWVICQVPQGSMVTPCLSASWGEDITALLLSVAAWCWQQSCGSTLPMDTGRHRDVVHHLRGLQEAAAHLSGQCPTRGDNASGSKGGWTAPQVYPRSSLCHQGGLMGCHCCSLSSAKKRKDVKRSSVMFLCPPWTVLKKESVFS